MQEVFGYIGALCIGLVLGITGGGGSILTVPILVYILNLNPVIATAYSLFIVGTTAAFGTVKNYRSGYVVPKTAIQFAIPSVLGVYITRKYIVHNLPDVIFYFGSAQLTKATFLMLVFALMMFLAAYSMLKKKGEPPLIEKTKNRYLILVELFFVGVLIGLIGAGGGFLIIPALVQLARLPMKKSIGTSLLIITINSLIGFAGDIANIAINWPFLLIFTAISVAGIFIGLKIQHLINEKHLQKIFGTFILVIAILILYEEIFS
jgi:uncharacterized membrane protein YfcA